MSRAARREKTLVAGHGALRRASTLLPLTPSSVRREMIEEGRIVATELDRMLTDDEATVLERWALNEQGVSGRAKTQRWDDQPRGSGRTDFALIHDDLMGRIVRHGQVKRTLDAHMLEILAAFTAMQNRLPDALPASRYGLHFCGFRPKDKAKAFYGLVVLAAKQLVSAKY
jgi:hypothetical protein